MQSGVQDLSSLRRALNDLLGLTALPRIWATYEPLEIIKSLTDVLETTLNLNMVYISLKLATEDVPIQMVRTEHKLMSPHETQSIGKFLTPYLTLEHSRAVVSIDDPFHPQGTMQIAVAPIGYTAMDGFVVFGVREPQSLSDLDGLLLRVAINQAVTSLQQAQLVRDLRAANELKEQALLQEQRARTESEAVHQRMRFLAETSFVLAAAPNYETALDYVMEIAVPAIADWCTIILLDDEETPTIKTVAKTQSIQDLVSQLQKQILLDSKSHSIVAEVIQSGTSRLIPQIDEAMIEQSPIGAEYSVMLRELHPLSALVVPLQARGQIFGALAMSICDREYRYGEDDLALAEGLANRISVTLDRDRLQKAERQAKDVLQVRVQLQALISDLGQQALTSDDLPNLLSRAAQILTENLGVEYSKILELQRDKNLLFLKAGVGWRKGHVGRTTLSPGLESQSGYTLLSSRPVIVEDLATETRFHGHSLFSEHNVVSGVSVIIQGHEGPWGVLGVHSSRHRTFSQDDIHFVQSVANILGAALERARWYEDAQKAATLQERHRIARELHDAVSQTLFAANLLAESLPQLWVRQPDKAHARTQQLHQLTRGAAAEMRILLIELRPESVISADLGYLLAQLGYAMPGRQNIDISVKLQGWNAQSLPPDVQMTFYRIAQESLNNIIKHGQSKQARIRLTQKAGHVIVTITDNGKGFDTRRMGSGLGLKSMIERATSIGAVISVKSRIGRGTQVKLVWAIAEDGAGETISDESV